MSFTVESVEWCRESTTSPVERSGKHCVYLEVEPDEKQDRAKETPELLG